MQRRLICKPRVIRILSGIWRKEMLRTCMVFSHWVSPCHPESQPCYPQIGCRKYPDWLHSPSPPQSDNQSTEPCSHWLPFYWMLTNLQSNQILAIGRIPASFFIWAHHGGCGWSLGGHWWDASRNYGLLWPIPFLNPSCIINNPNPNRVFLPASPNNVLKLPH